MENLLQIIEIYENLWKTKGTSTGNLWKSIENQCKTIGKNIEIIENHWNSIEKQCKTN